MLLTLCKSKIAAATVTAAELEYEGSITIDAELAEAAGLFAGEQVHVLNLNNGSRVETYVILGERGSGIICLNGPAARTALVGDRVIVLCYAQMTEEEAGNWKMTLVRVDEKNRVIR